MGASLEVDLQEPFGVKPTRTELLEEEGAGLEAKDVLCPFPFDVERVVGPGAGMGGGRQVGPYGFSDATVGWATGANGQAVVGVEEDQLQPQGLEVKPDTVPQVVREVGQAARELLKGHDGRVVGGVDGQVVHEPAGVTPPIASGSNGDVLHHFGVVERRWGGKGYSPMVKGHEVSLD